MSTDLSLRERIRAACNVRDSSGCVDPMVLHRLAELEESQTDDGVLASLALPVLVLLRSTNEFNLGERARILSEIGNTAAILVTPDQLLWLMTEPAVIGIQIG